MMLGLNLYVSSLSQSSSPLESLKLTFIQNRLEINKQRVYVCTLSALESKLCTESSLGKFIITPPPNNASTTIFTSSVHFDSGTLSTTPPIPISDTLPLVPRQSMGHSGPYKYPVTKTGFYCVGTVPVLVSGGVNKDVSFTGVVDFENVFKGRLPAAEKPKISVSISSDLLVLNLKRLWCSFEFSQVSDSQNFEMELILIFVFSFYSSTDLYFSSTL